MKPLQQSFPPPPAFVNARPCSATYGSTPAKYQADFKTPLPAFNGATLPVLALRLPARAAAQRL